jgi:hypothetical protein
LARPERPPPNPVVARIVDSANAVMDRYLRDKVAHPEKLLP